MESINENFLLFDTELLYVLLAKFINYFCILNRLSILVSRYNFLEFYDFTDLISILVS